MLPTYRSTGFFLFAILSTVAACGDPDDGTTSSELRGDMRYRDAATNPDGSAREAATPPADQGATITVTVEGTGTLDGLDGTRCELEGAAGQFQALFDAQAQLDGSGAYVAALSATDARILTPGGCAIPNLTVGVITDVRVRGEIAATTASCHTYCAANARATAEAQCSAAADQAQCRAAAEGTAAAACESECTTQRHVIVAETSLAASLLGNVDADSLRSAALGELSVDVTFDRME
jgi:hypothetical protein